MRSVTLAHCDPFLQLPPLSTFSSLVALSPPPHHHHLAVRNHKRIVAMKRANQLRFRCGGTMRTVPSIPDGVNAYRISNRILSALRLNGIQGPVSINAFGNICEEIPHATQEALISTGISLVDGPISGDQKDANNSVFSSILHRLRMNNYNELMERVTDPMRELEHKIRVTFNKSTKYALRLIKHFVTIELDCKKISQEAFVIKCFCPGNGIAAES